MLPRLVTFVISTLAITSLAVPTIPKGGYNCGNGSEVQCCNSKQDAASASGGVKSILGLLGINLSDLTGQIGLQCTSVNVLALGGQNCASQTVCCNENNFNGLINLGCTPINVQL